MVPIFICYRDSHSPQYRVPQLQVRSCPKYGWRWSYFSTKSEWSVLNFLSINFLLNFVDLACITACEIFSGWRDYRYGVANILVVLKRLAVAPIWNLIEFQFHFDFWISFWLWFSFWLFILNLNDASQAAYKSNCLCTQCLTNMVEASCEENAVPENFTPSNTAVNITLRTSCSTRTWSCNVKPIQRTEHPWPTTHTACIYYNGCGGCSWRIRSQHPKRTEYCQIWRCIYPCVVSIQDNNL